MSTFPISMANPAMFVGTLPIAADVVVIGGGIIGVLTAWELGKRGLSVVLCEKGRIAGEQSSRNWGWIRQQGRDYAELPIMVDAIPLWTALPDKLKDAIGFRQRGITYLARNKDKLGEHEQWLEGARAFGVDTHMLSRRETETMFPDANCWIGGITTPSDAMAEPFVAVPLLAKAAEESGVIIRENCAVRSMDIVAGNIRGVYTEYGKIKCERIVLAAGSWSSLFLASHGMHIPQLSVTSPVLQTAPMPAFFEGAATDDRIAFRHRADGGYTLAPWSKHDFSIGPDAFRNFFSYLPQLRNDFTSTRFKLAAPKNYPDAWFTERNWKPDQVRHLRSVGYLIPGQVKTTLIEFWQRFQKYFLAFRNRKFLTPGLALSIPCLTSYPSLTMPQSAV